MKGWKTAVNNGLIYCIYNQDTVYCTVEVTNTQFNTTFQAFSGQTIGSAPKPVKPVLSPAYNNNNLLFAIYPDGLLYRRSMTGANVSSVSGQATFTWHY